MVHQLAELMAERIAAGLKRKSLTTCSRYTQAVRVMGKPYPGPWTFLHHPWLREMHDSVSEMIVGQKSAQMGYTEWALNVAFFNIDIKGASVLYVLPTKTPDAGDFSAARFDPALELSTHLMKLFSDVKNVGHKRAGNTNLYIRGSKSRAGLKSLPTGLIILDEVDEMDQDNVPLAMERAAGQVEKQVLALSTPTIPMTGINKLFSETTQEHFFFRCPCCGKMTELMFPQCLEITGQDVNDETLSRSYLKCKECQGLLDHKTKHMWLAGGKWVPEYSNRDSRGFHINQMYSSTVSPLTLAKSYLRSLRDQTEEQEFYNSKLGLPHIVEGAGVTDADLDRCIGSSKMVFGAYGRLITMGVDVGRWLHYEINEWFVPGNVNSADLNVQSTSKILNAGKVRDFEELDKLMVDFQVLSCVIDANPERRKAYEFASRFFGRVKMCFYGQSIQGKQIHIGSETSSDEPIVTVDRTSWLDMSLSRFRNETIQLPLDIPQEYRIHMKSPVRVYEKDKNGNPTGRYVKGNDDDHHAHARNYAEIALPFALSLGQSQDTESPV